MNGRSLRYICRGSGRAVDLHVFGSPHHAGIGCAECDRSMELRGEVQENGVVVVE